MYKSEVETCNRIYVEDIMLKVYIVLSRHISQPIPIIAIDFPMYFPLSTNLISPHDFQEMLDEAKQSIVDGKETKTGKSTCII